MASRSSHFSQFGVSGHYRRQRLHVRRPNGFDRPKMLSQRLPPFWSHTGNVVQSGTGSAFAVAFVVKGDGKAVGLLLNLPDKGKHRLVSHNADLPPLGGHQGAGAVTVVLHHAEDGHCGVKLLRHTEGRLGVGHAAVDQKYVRQG